MNERAKVPPPRASAGDRQDPGTQSTPAEPEHEDCSTEPAPADLVDTGGVDLDDEYEPL